MLGEGAGLLKFRHAAKFGRGAGSDDGFTLLEVLVALAILAMSLTILFGTFTMALDRTRQSQSRLGAEHLAEALLLNAETAPAATLRDTHGTDASLEWSIKTSPFGSDDDRRAWQGRPVQISVEVRWQDHGRSRTVSLSTVRILPEGNHG